MRVLSALFLCLTTFNVLSQSTALADFNKLYPVAEEALRSKDYPKAEELFLKARDAASKAFGPNSAQLRNVYWSLAYVYKDSNQPAKTESSYNDALKVHHTLKSTGDDSKDFVSFTEEIAKYFGDQKKLTTSIRLYKMAAAERERHKFFEGWNYYWDLKHTLDYLYELGKKDSLDYYFEKITNVLPVTEPAYVSHITDWAWFSISQKAQNNFDRIEKYCEEYLNIKSQKNEKDAYYARCLIVYGRLLAERGQTQRGLKSLAEARVVLEPIKDANKIVYLKGLYYQAEAYNAQKKYDAVADKLFSDYEKINEQWASVDPRTYDDGQMELLNYNYWKGNYPKAEALVRKSIVAFEKQYGKDDKDYKLLNLFLAGILEKQGKMEESQKIVKSFSAKDESDVIEALGLNESMGEAEELGRYLKNSEYVKAIRLFEKSAGMIASAFIKKNDYSALVDINLGMAYCYREIGNFSSAEVILLEADKIAHEKLGRTHPSTILATWNKGEFYQTVGSLGLAKGYYDEALDILDEIRTDANKKENDEQYYNILSRVAGIYQAWGDFKTAEKLYYKVLGYKETVFGYGSLEYVTTDKVLADMYHAMKLFPLAEKIYDQVEPEIKKSGDEATYISLLSSMAINYQVRANYAKAEPLFLKVKDFYARTYGMKSERYAAILSDLAVFYYHSNQWEKSIAAFRELNQLSIYKVDNFFASLSEREKTAFYSSIQKAFNKYNSFVIHYADKNPSEMGEFYNLQLMTKGLLFRSTNKVRETILASKDDSLKALYNRWLMRKDVLSKVYQMGDDEKKAAGINEKLMEASVNELEKSLTKRSEQFTSLLPARPDWKQIQKKLKPGEAAVEIVRLYDARPVYEFDYIGKGFQYDSVENDFYNVDIVLSSRTPAHRAGIKEGDQLMEINGQTTKGKTVEQIGDLISANPAKLKLKRKGTSTVYNVELKSDSVFNFTYNNPVIYAALILTPETINNPQWVLLNNGDQLEKRYLPYYRNAIKSKLEDQYSYNMFWKPIREKLKSATTIYFSPDGVYNSINLNTLYNTETGNYLLDEMKIKLVGNTSDLLKEAPVATASQIVLVGFPDYNASGTAAANSNLTSLMDFKVLKSDTSQRFMSGSVVSELPGTQAEINGIEKVFLSKKSPVSKWMSRQASEENLKSLHSPKVLHIATHGFFMDDAATSGNERGITGMSGSMLRSNALFRSGLLLAGAGKTISTGKENAQSEDGILTAYEAMNLDLQKTELVVLSACETGLGQVKAGEGVYGLQRAFRSAGAQSVLMSLWKVDDQATQELMTNFYQQWQNGGSRSDSFTSAMTKLRTTFKHPYYWGHL